MTRKEGSTETKWIALLAATRSETGGLLRLLKIEKRWRVNGASGWEGDFGGKKTLLLQTGMGRENAEKAARLALERYSPSALVSFGFGGGLTDWLQRGDLALCSRLFNSDPTQAGLAVDSDPELIEVGLSLAIAGRQAMLATSVSMEDVIIDPVEKLRIGRKYGADVGEMEGYWIGRKGQEMGVPFLALRAISDPVDQRLPDFRGLAASKHLNRAAAGFLFTHPQEWSKMPGFLLNLQIARRRMIEFLDSFLKTDILKG